MFFVSVINTSCLWFHFITTRLKVTSVISAALVGLVTLLACLRMMQWVEWGSDLRGSYTLMLLKLFADIKFGACLQHNWAAAAMCNFAGQYANSELQGLPACRSAESSLTPDDDIILLVPPKDQNAFDTPPWWTGYGRTLTSQLWFWSCRRWAIHSRPQRSLKQSNLLHMFACRRGFTPGH